MGNLPRHALLCSWGCEWLRPPQSQQLDPSTPRLPSAPQAIWQAVLGYVKAPHVPPASFTAALPLLATIARKRLAQLPPGFHKLWGLPLLEQAPSPAVLDFATAAVASGQGAAIDSATWQPALLHWLRTAAAVTAPSSVSAAVAAVLKLPDGGSSGGGSSSSDDSGGGDSGDGAAEDAPSLGTLRPGAEDRWWHWWQEDASLSAQIAGLIRGAGQPGLSGEAGRVAARAF